MMPEFRIVEGGYKITGDDELLHRKRKCDCGSVATIIATVETKPLASTTTGRPFRGDTVLTLCSDCAALMAEDEVEHVKQMNSNYCYAHYMSISEALHMAPDLAKRNNRRGGMKKGHKSQKWHGIIKLIGEKGELSAKDINTFLQAPNTSAASSGLGRLERVGILASRREGIRKIYSLAA